MPRIAGVADLHISASHLTTLDDQELALERVRDACVERQVGLLLIAGDVFDTNRPSPAAIAVAGRFFEQLESGGIRAVVAPGNHDPEAAQIAAYLRGRVRVPAKPDVLSLVDGVDVAVMPWLPDSYVRAQLAGEASREEIAQCLSAAAVDILSGLRAQRRPGIPLVLVGHFTVAGSETPTGWNMGWRPGTSWVVPVEELHGFDLVVAGHVHKHQTPAPHVVVPGSLLPLDFSETQPHGFVVADLDESLWEFVEIQTPQLVTWSMRLPGDEPEIDALLSGSGARFDDALVRVRLRADEERARIYPPARIERALLDGGARKVQVELTVDREDRARDAGMTAELSPLSALAQYLEGRDDLEAPARDKVASCAAAAVAEVLHGEDAAGVGDLRVARVRATNFLGVADAEFELRGVGLAALVAPVGMGKSTLGADVVRFALFGATRQGARASERLVRAGEREASVAVDLEGPGSSWRIVRKVKVDARGRASQTLDVLERDPAVPFEAWRPLSSGKLADGEAHIARILGGLGDRALTAANLVVQRQGNVFAAARPEERKELLAEAGGLDVYTDLGLLSAKHLNEADKELSKVEASAATLRDRAQSAQRLEGERAAAAMERDAAASAVQGLEREHTSATELLEKAQERAAELDRVSAEALRTQQDIERVDGQVSEWAHKADVARQVLSQKAQLEEAKKQLAGARATIERLEGELAEAHRVDRTISDSRARIADLERDLAALRTHREALGRAFAGHLEEAMRRRDDLRASGCLEHCTHVASCTVAAQATANDGRIAEQQEGVERHRFPTDKEHDLAGRIAIEKKTQHTPPDTNGISAELVLERERARDLERQTGLAEKLAAADQVLKEHDDQVAKLRAELAPLRRRRGDLNARLLALGSARGELDRATGEQSRLASEISRTRTEERRAGERVALLDGRLEELRAAAAELVVREAAITSGAREVAAWKELIVAWRACRVMVLETSVIPAVEDMANEVLRRFPYGLQLRFATQREKKGGDGLAETLDIEVLGGKGPVYELLSGGQQMAVDCALHLAIALVVFRRQRSRLAYLFLDEPEGLDEPGRAAFAAIARWMHETFGGTTLVASHHADLIDALGGEVIRIEGEPGNARVGAPMAEAA